MCGDVVDVGGDTGSKPATSREVICASICSCSLSARAAWPATCPNSSQRSPEDLELLILARISGGGDHAVQPGPTHLVAAMRTYVAWKFGEEVVDEQARGVFGRSRYG